jgi:hypothetical protein
MLMGRNDHPAKGTPFYPWQRKVSAGDTASDKPEKLKSLTLSNSKLPQKHAP